MVNPRKVVRKSTYNAALRTVNLMRRTMGKKVLKSLPNGEPGDEVSCPLAIALGAKVDGDTVEVSAPSPKMILAAATIAAAGSLTLNVDGGNSLNMEAPPEFVDFVEEFDNSEDQW